MSTVFCGQKMSTVFCGHSATEGVGGDCSFDVNQENLEIMKQEPDDVCWFLYIL